MTKATTKLLAMTADEQQQREIDTQQIEAIGHITAIEEMLNTAFFTQAWVLRDEEDERL